MVDIGSTEHIPAADGSVDLITSGVLAHYFDLPKFFAKAKHVLKPSGCIALFAYMRCPREIYKIYVTGIDTSESMLFSTVILQKTLQIWSMICSNLAFWKVVLNKILFL